MKKKIVMENKVVLKGHCHQGSPLFGANPGSQCKNEKK
jgi:hypothetical protein